eukprot:5876071-Pyramimonas_sp.AAC.2
MRKVSVDRCASVAEEVFVTNAYRCWVASHGRRARPTSWRCWVGTASATSRRSPAPRCRGIPLPRSIPCAWDRVAP